MISVGIIVDEPWLTEMVHELIEKSKYSRNYEISALIVQRFENGKGSGHSNTITSVLKKDGLIGLINRAFFKFIQVFERKIVRHFSSDYSIFNKYSVDTAGVPEIHVTPIISKSGYVYRYSEEDLLKITNQNLNVLLRFGSGILRGDILTACEFGILSFHHADNDVNRGGPPAFWEVYNKECSTGFIIQRLLEEIDGGDVLFKGHIATAPLYVQNLVRVYRKSIFFMHQLLDDLGRNNQLPPVYKKTPYSYPLYRLPSLSQQLKYACYVVKYITKRLINKALKRSSRWGVAYQFVDEWQSAVMWRSTTIKNPPNRFLADPFLWKKDGATVCFVEDYDYRIQRAKISAFSIEKDKYSFIGEALAEPFHLSYPYIFEAEGGLYMCPESTRNNDIRIYKCLEFPLKWELHKVLMSGVHASDTNIFFHASKWWMFTNLDSSDVGDSSSELHIFCSEEFDGDEWLPHKQNPVLFDSKCARNGGWITEKGKLYRVFQVQGFDVYGESMGVAEIVSLSIDDYEEVVVSSIHPKFYPGISGTHTMSYLSGVFAFDFVNYERYTK